MEIPEDVKEKLLRFARAGIAVATMRGKSYLSIGSVSMGIAGSIQIPISFRNIWVCAMSMLMPVRLSVVFSWVFMIMKSLLVPWCGWKNIVRAMKGVDFNPEHLVYSREEKDARWEYVVKMTLIFRDMMIGNPKLAEMGFKEEAMGHNAIAAGFRDNANGQTISLTAIFQKLF